MADFKFKVKENAQGMFYVDDQCIACDACVVEAPNFFSMNDIDGYAFVSNQPQSEKEISSCFRALEACPVDAIGNDSNYLEKRPSKRGPS